MDATTSAAVADFVAAIVGDAVVAIASVAANTAVSPDTVSAVAAAHGDDTFCRTHARHEAARDAMRDLAQRTVRVLLPLYSDRRMLDAVVAASAPPVVDAAHGTVVLDGQVFKTSRGVLMEQIWLLLHPGHAVVAAFFEMMRSTQNDLADPDDFLVFFNEAVPQSMIESSIRALALASRAAHDVVGESERSGRGFGGVE